MKITYFASILLSLLALSACQRPESTPQVNHNTISTDKCNKYTFLQPYGCSILTLEQNAENGDINAAYILGYVYYYGLGTPVDQASGKLWIEKAANEGQPQAIKAMALIERTQDSPPPINEHPLAKNEKKPQASPQMAKKRPLLSTQTIRHPAPIQIKPFYTIQIRSSKTDFSLAPLKRSFPGHHLNKLIHQDNQGVIWYALISGHYANKGAALNGIQALPKALLKEKPWVRRVEK